MLARHFVPLRTATAGPVTQPTPIKSVLDDTSLTGTTLTVAGWVRTFRNGRFIALNDGSTIGNLQCVIDQELEKVAPYMVGTFEKDGSQYLNADNNAMIHMLVNAMKEQQAETEKLRTMVLARER